MGSRRKSREVALQLLYMWEFASGDIDRALSHFWREGELDDKVVSFARNLALGTINNLEDIDKYITDSSEHWRLDRMALIDRNVMRMAVYEFLYTPSTPRKVVINEAIEVAKRFSTEESTQFVNGILDNIRKRIETDDKIKQQSP
jgi:N utilization substance protein B